MYTKTTKRFATICTLRFFLCIKHLMIKQRKITYKWSQLAPARDTGSGSKAVVLKLLSA
jgi:hypothetical protein